MFRSFFVFFILMNIIHDVITYHVSYITSFFLLNAACHLSLFVITSYLSKKTFRRDSFLLSFMMLEGYDTSLKNVKGSMTE